jgi:hypothetical protein
LIVVVPDTFVSLDYFPLPFCVCPSDLKRHISSLMETQDMEKASDGGEQIQQVACRSDQKETHTMHNCREN